MVEAVDVEVVDAEVVNVEVVDVEVELEVKVVVEVVKVEVEDVSFILHLGSVSTGPIIVALPTVNERLSYRTQPEALEKQDMYTQAPMVARAEHSISETLTTV